MGSVVQRPWGAPGEWLGRMGAVIQEVCHAGGEIPRRLRKGSKVVLVLLGAAYQVLGRSAGGPSGRGASPGFLLPERGEQGQLEGKQRPPPPNAEIPPSPARLGEERVMGEPAR